MIYAITNLQPDRALICSGFFQEDIGGYQASMEANFIGSLASNGTALDLVGVYNGYWLQRYKDFADSMRTGGVTVRAKRAPKYRWHAKVFILKKNNRPIFGIVGSSNMTSRAFGDANSGALSFNNECDVVMWSGNHARQTMNRFVRDIYDDYAADIFQVRYSQAENRGMRIGDRLSYIEEQIGFENLSDLE